jgi:L-amino acid N-acyltransferase YncA
MMTTPQIRPMTFADWDAVARIYKEGIDTKLATFETEVPAWEKWDSSRLQECRFVVANDGELLGWAALSPVSSRYVYRGVMDIGIYISANARGKGIGKMLLNHLVAASEQCGIWTLQAGIFSHNHASIALHSVCGLRIVGTREKIGQLDGVWYDTVLMERRSTKVGI